MPELRLKLGRVLAIDTEWTCWEGEPPPGQEREIIEIGVVEADPRSMEILRGARFLVRPALSTVSDYCTRLTGLTQEEVRREGRPLGEVLRTLAKAYGPGAKPWIAWGEDRNGLAQACERLGAANPFPDEGFINLGMLYGLVAGSATRPGLAGAMEDLGIEPEGRAHTALADARNAMRVWLDITARLRPSLSPAADPPAFGR